MSARDILGLWCDDITFCPNVCDVLVCPRNKENIRGRTIPHSYSVETPSDCPKSCQDDKEDINMHELLNKITDAKDTLSNVVEQTSFDYFLYSTLTDCYEVIKKMERQK